MVCDRCGPSKEQGFSFCPGCGNPLKEGCIYCPQYRLDGYKYCGVCGRRLEPGPVREEKSLVRLAPLTAMPFVLILILAEVAMMLLSSADVLGFLPHYGKNVLVIAPVLMNVGTLTGAPLQAYWLLCILIVLMSVAMLFYRSGPMFRSKKDRDVGAAEDTPLYWICLLFGSVMILELLMIDAISALSGTVMDLPDWLTEMSMPQLVFEMVDAAVWEEIMARALPIGIPLALLALCHGRKDFLRYLLGGFGTSRLAWALIIASAIMFGAAHNAGWGFVKVIPTMIGGIALGYLYVRFGVLTSILFHFMTDMTSTLMFDEASTMMVGLLTMFILITGLICLATLFAKLSDGIKDAKSLSATGFEDQT